MNQLVKLLDQVDEIGVTIPPSEVITKVFGELQKLDPNGKDNEAALRMAVKFLQLKKMQTHIQWLISLSTQVNDAASTGGTTSIDKNELYQLIYILQAIYNYSGIETGVSDPDYDRLYEMLVNLGDEIISTPIVSGKIAHHNYPSLPGTLQKIYAVSEKDVLRNKSRRSLDQWIKEKERIYEAVTGDKINLSNVDIYVFPKWDGVSVTFEFDKSNRLVRALTRGNTDTNEAQDITHIFAPIQDRIKDEKMFGVSYGLKTEVMMSDKDLEKCNKKYAKKGVPFKNTRSVISSIVNSGEVDDRINYLEIVGLRVSMLDDEKETLQELASNAFHRPYLVCKMSDRDAIRDFAFKHRFVDGLRCDGAVIYIQDANIRKVLGRKDHKNQYEVAYKFNEDIAYAKIKDITFSTTDFGKVFPTAVFEPCKMKGNTITNASLGSIARFHELHLAKGDTVKILYEIIPYLLYDENDPNCKRSGKKPIPLPEVCPECGGPLDYNDTKTVFRCNNFDCPSKQRGLLLNYAQRLGMEWFGEQTIQTLYDMKILREIPDFYKLLHHKKKLLSMDSMGDKRLDNLVDSVLHHGIYLEPHIFLGALGIEGIGKKTFEKIFEKYTFDELMEIVKERKVSKLVEIPSISDKTANAIINGIRERKKLIKELTEHYVQIASVKKKKDAKFRTAFHKVRSNYLTDLMEKAGGVVEDNLTKKTSFLIVPNGFDGNSSKAEKARKYGVPMVELDAVDKYLRQTYSIKL